MASVIFVITQDILVGQTCLAGFGTQLAVKVDQGVSPWIMAIESKAVRCEESEKLVKGSGVCTGAE